MNMKSKVLFSYLQLSIMFFEGYYPIFLKFFLLKRINIPVPLTFSYQMYVHKKFGLLLLTVLLMIPSSQSTSLMCYIQAR